MKNSLVEKIVIPVLIFSTLVSVITTVSIVFILGTESYPLFKQVSVGEFITGTVWAPLFKPPAYGVLPLVCGTFLVVCGAALFAFPIGLFCSIYLSFYAKSPTRKKVKPIVEILAGIPTVVYGYFALTFISPGLGSLFETIKLFNALSASIVVGIMILPMIISLCDDAFQSVPKSIYEGGFSLGATKKKL